METRDRGGIRDGSSLPSKIHSSRVIAGIRLGKQRNSGNLRHIGEMQRLSRFLGLAFLHSG